MTNPTIVVPLDASEHALAALPVAKRIAELEGATLHIVHVTKKTSPPAQVLDELGLSGVELRGSVLDMKTGDPAEGIVQVAKDVGATFVVMCTHTASGPDTTVGATALAVLKGLPCPVVLVRPERGRIAFSLRTILLPHDGTPTTSAAIHPAADLAHKAGAMLDVLHVAAPGTRPPPEHGSLPPPRYTDQPQHEWPAWAGEFIERLRCVCPLDISSVRMFMGHGAPADQVLAFAKEHGSDLVVVAWRGAWEGEHATTLKEIIHRSVAPVMVIRAKS